MDGAQTSKVCQRGNQWSFGVQFQKKNTTDPSISDPPLRNHERSMPQSFNLSSARSLAPKTSRREQTSKDRFIWRIPRIGLWLWWRVPEAYTRVTRPGKPTKNDGKSPFIIGKSTISMIIFKSYLKLPEGMEKDGKIWDFMVDVSIYSYLCISY